MSKKIFITIFIFGLICLWFFCRKDPLSGFLFAEKNHDSSNYQTPLEVASLSKTTLIDGVIFDDSSIQIYAPGSDNWPITWAENDRIYTTWGDGGGFGGTNKDGRVSLGVAFISGSKGDYTGENISSPFSGKSVGILALGNILYLWRCGDDSHVSAFKFSRLYRSDDLGKTWSDTGVQFSRKAGDFKGSDLGFFEPAFCQFGKGYKNNIDDYVYIYAPEIIDISSWSVQKPGRIALMRVRRSDIEKRENYQFFSGWNKTGEPLWTGKISKRTSVFSDEEGVHRLAVSYNEKLDRYLLTKNFSDRRGTFSLYESKTPWGPWTLVYKERNEDRWGSKVIIYSFVDKWLSDDGKEFILVYTKDDSFASIAGKFVLR